MWALRVIARQVRNVVRRHAARRRALSALERDRPQAMSCKGSTARKSERCRSKKGRDVWVAPTLEPRQRATNTCPYARGAASMK